MWEYLSYADATAEATYQPTAGTATKDNPGGNTVIQKCFKASSDVYLMEQKSYTVVPNWDLSCDSSNNKNFRIRYDISRPTKFPNKIQPFRNTFNGDDVLQLCAWGRVYACTSNRPCDIVFGDYNDVAGSLTEVVANTFAGFGSVGINPWLDSTNLDLLGNTGDVGSSYTSVEHFE